MARVTAELEEIVLDVRCLRWMPRADDEASAQLPPANFGDLLGPIIARRIVEAHDTRLDPSRARRLLSVGSILHFSEPGDVVWGSGVNGKIGTQHIPPSLDVRAVRGPYTRAVLAGRGVAAPAVYGDPALLVGRLWPELLEQARHKSRPVIAVPNLNEPDLFDDEVSRTPLGDPWEIIADIAASEFVTGTSLHALIIADALGVPCRPIIPKSESPLKYVDYYAGTGRHRVRFAETVDEALALGPLEPPQFDAEALLRAFPIDLWTGEAAPPNAEPLRFQELRGASEIQLADLVALEGEEPSAEATTAHGRARMLAKRNPPLDGLTREELAFADLERDAAADRPAQAEQPVLSVVIPTHNVRPWVGETIHSVLSQDVDGMEVVVVDDHSTDGTRAALDLLAASDDRIRIIDAVTKGGGTARNIGIDHARGRYLAFCDGDDIVPDGAYRAMVASLEASGSEIAFGDYLKFSPIRTWRPTASWPAYAAAKQGVQLADEPSLIYGRPCWNKVFRRSFWADLDIRFPDVPRSNDIVPMVTAYVNAKRIDVVDEVVYLYRERPGASSMTSKAGSATALISYLTQEIACAELVRGVDAPALHRAYASLILDRDGWVHLAKYLRADERDPEREAEILALVRTLVGRIDRSPAKVREVQKRSVLTLLLDGHVDLAAAVATLFSGPAPSLERRIAAWRRIVDGARLDGVDLLQERFFALRLIDALSAGVLDGTDATDAALIELALAVPAEHGRLIRAVPELAAVATESTAHLAERFAKTRSTAALFTHLETGRSVRVRITGAETGRAFEPVLFDEASGAVHPMRTTGERSDEAVVWHGSSSSAKLPKHTPLRPALRERATGDVVSARFRAVTPEYDRFDRFLLHFDGRGVRVARRPHWIVRIGVRATKVVAGRVQPRRSRSSV